MFCGLTECMMSCDGVFFDVIVCRVCSELSESLIFYDFQAWVKSSELVVVFDFL